MSDSLAPGFEILPTPPRRGHGRLIGSIAAVVVLAAGGAITYVAFAAGDSGASSPKQAVQNVVADLENADLIGVLDDLAPGERAALTAPIRDDISSLKRLGALSPSADPSAVPGVHFKANDLTYSDQTIVVNDHVQIVQITGGSVDLSAEAAKLPFTKRFAGLVNASSRPASRHVAITKPIRIATQKVGDSWYASIFYTAADEAAHHAIPTPADRLAAQGAGSPETAVEKLVRSLLAGDVSSALALVSPDELGAVHDYGTMLLKAAPRWQPAHVTIKTLDLTTTPIDHGVRVGLKNLALSVGGGRDISVAIANGCANIAAAGFHKLVCPADAGDLISGLIGNLTCLSSFSSYAPRGTIGSTIAGGNAVSGCHGPKFTAAQKQAIADLFSGLTSLGIATAQVGGQWFITPVRTAADLGATVLSGLKGDDLFQLATLGK